MGAIGAVGAGTAMIEAKHRLASSLIDAICGVSVNWTQPPSTLCLLQGSLVDKRRARHPQTLKSERDFEKDL